MELAPIVVFSYNRPYYLRQTLQALSQNLESRESLLYIYCDGPKKNASDDELNKINEARAVAHEHQWCGKVVVVESDTNKGLSKAIISGVTDLLENHDAIIVLEDDLVTSPYFLNYMNTALTKYHNNEEVVSIVGYNYPLIYDEYDQETFFLKNADCWGWATWKRGWKLFEQDANVLINKLEAAGLTREFNFDNRYPYMKMLRGVANGAVDSWAVRWYASCFLLNKLTLFPKKSLVRNIGSEGTNFKADNSDIFGWEISDQRVNSFESEIIENQNLRKKLSLHFLKYNRRRLTFYNLKYALDRFFGIKL